jgi:REP element-mobilizing transposase RayT
MTDRFKNIYRIPTARWKEWDYGANAAYFVTVCTAHRERFFGEISKGEMNLSEIGKTVQAEWLKTPELRPDMNIMLGEYVVMPNHFHGIIVIGENRYNTDGGDGDDDGDDGDGGDGDGVGVGGDGDGIGGDGDGVGGDGVGDDGDGVGDVQTRCIASLRQYQWQPNRFGSQSKNLASVMRGFKSAVTKFARMNSIPFAWQTRFHDRVIRNFDEHNRIAYYINGNIENWKDDEMYV